MAQQLRTTEASATWAALLGTYSALRDSFADELEAQTGLSLDRYEILLMLSQHDDGMQPSQIADARKLSRSGATRLIDRLERDGLVSRCDVDHDRRASWVRLTKAGREQFIKAGRVHLDSIDRQLGSRLTTAQMAELRALLGALGPAPPPSSSR